LIQCVRKCKPSTVFINIEGTQMIGSGVIVDPRGYVVTNHHVVEKSKSANVRILDTEKVLKAEVIQRVP
jgi:S1-C subfamily serine protease